jgi:hypothetical protein
MRTLRFLVLAVLGLLVGFGARQLWSRPTAAPAQFGLAAKVRPSTPASRRLAERVAARPAALPVAEGPDVVIKAEFFPRDAGEWQGMRILTTQPACSTSETCGLGLACVENRCGPCQNDGQCLSNERCAVDHCVPAAGLACRSQKDCASGELCVLTPYSADARGNTGMRSRCLAPEGGTDVPEEPAAEEPAAPADFGDYTPPQDLLDTL